MLKGRELCKKVDTFNSEAATIQEEAGLDPNECLRAGVAPSAHVTKPRRATRARTPVGLWLQGLAQGVFLTSMDSHDQNDHLPVLSRTLPETAGLVRSVSALAIATDDWDYQKSVDLGKGFDYLLAGMRGFGFQCIATTVNAHLDVELLPGYVQAVLTNTGDQDELIRRQQLHSYAMSNIAADNPQLTTIQ